MCSAVVKLDIQDDLKEPLAQQQDGVDEVDFSKINLEDTFKYLNVSQVTRGGSHRHACVPARQLLKAALLQGLPVVAC